MDKETMITVIAQFGGKALDTLTRACIASEAMHVEDAKNMESEHLLQLRLAQLELSRHTNDQVFRLLEEAMADFRTLQVERLSVSRIEAEARAQEAENERMRLENERKHNEAQAQHLENQKIWMQTKAQEAENERARVARAAFDTVPE